MSGKVPTFKAIQVAADNDRFGGELLFLNGRFDCKVSAKETNGDLCIYDTVRTEKGGPPLHFHHTQDEWFFVREGEFLCNSVIGFNFGDGHLHNHDFVTAVQREARFEPGEAMVFWVESQPVHRDHQEYQIIDAAVGVVERGTWKVADAVAEQPWLPNGPIPTQVTWTAGVTA